MPLPAATDGWKGNGLQLLVIRQRQAVLHRLLQKFLTLVCTPDGTVTVDHKLGGQAMACTDSSCRGRARSSEWGSHTLEEWNLTLRDKPDCPGKGTCCLNFPGHIAL